MAQTLMPIAVVFLGVWSALYFKPRLQRQTIALSEMVRETKNPPYPLTSQEVLKYSRELNGHPFETLKFSVVTLGRQVNLVWGAYPDEPGLQSLARAVRKTITLYIIALLTVFMLALVLSIVLR